MFHHLLTHQVLQAIINLLPRVPCSSSMREEDIYSTVDLASYPLADVRKIPRTECARANTFAVQVPVIFALNLCLRHFFFMMLAFL